LATAVSYYGTGRRIEIDKVSAQGISALFGGGGVKSIMLDIIEYEPSSGKL